ncbi:hypothetical protein PTKIN_Ptkin09bG0170000 [Pterospermum kingtungense]
MDRIRWGLTSHAGKNREFLKVVAHLQLQCPSKPANFRDAMGEYYKRFLEVELDLAKAISKILGYEETYIEKEFKLEASFDVSATNLYPPSFQSKEILTNGKYKSHIHQVVLDNNEVNRIIMATLHRPSLDAFVAPTPGFVDECNHQPTEE